VKRPDGTVETVAHPKIDWFNDQIFRQMKKAMAAAGRGTPISYKNIEAVVEMEDSDYAGHCERCGANLDIRTAYSQIEWTRFGGRAVQVKAHYCDNCARLLAAVGAGEASELDNRAGAVPSVEPHTKNDND